MTALWTVSFEADNETARELAERLSGAAHPAALSVSRFEQPGGRAWSVEALYAAPLDRADFAPLLGEKRALTLQIARLADEDWVAKSLHGLPPVRSGRLYIHGAHDEGAAPAGTIPIRIEAGLAFGTGHHGTTLGCLDALNRLHRDYPMRDILDLGCGSGVLAIAAAKLWRGARVTAADTDPDAVAVARENARANEVPHVTVLRAAGFASAALRRRGPFDLILANILAGPLTRLAPDVTRMLRPGGLVVLSGLLQDQAQTVLNFYRGRGLNMEARCLIEGWATLSLRKPPGNVKWLRERM